MSKSKPKLIPLCEKCRKPLENTACPACDGSGYYQESPEDVQECKHCNGSGRVLKCPDELKHILDDLGIVITADPGPIYNSFQRGKTFVLTSGHKIIPPWHSDYPKPWHPNHPLNPNNPLNPNSPINPVGLRDNPFNWNNDAQKNSRLPGDAGTDAPPPVKKP